MTLGNPTLGRLVWWQGLVAGELSRTQRMPVCPGRGGGRIGRRDGTALYLFFVASGTVPLPTPNCPEGSSENLSMLKDRVLRGGQPCHSLPSSLATAQPRSLPVSSGFTEDL